MASKNGESNRKVSFFFCLRPQNQAHILPRTALAFINRGRCPSLFRVRHQTFFLWGYVPRARPFNVLRRARLYTHSACRVKASLPHSVTLENSTHRCDRVHTPTVPTTTRPSCHGRRSPDAQNCAEGADAGCSQLCQHRFFFLLSMIGSWPLAGSSRSARRCH